MAEPRALVEAPPAVSSDRRSGRLSGTVSAGVRWSAVEHAARFAVMVLVTRLISPRDFGLAALAFLLGHLAPLLGDLGLGAALVHREDLQERHVTTAFTASILFGAVLTSAVAAASPLLADFFREPDLSPLLMVISTTFLLRGALSTPRDMLRRGMHLRAVVLATTTGVVVAGGAAVVAAAQGAGAWSLVVYTVGENAVALVVMWWIARRYHVWRPRLGLDPDAFRSLLRFGAPVTAHQMLYYGHTHLDDVLVGRFLGAQALGFYGLAYRLMLLPIVKVADVVHVMVFPALASMQSEMARFRAAFSRAVQAVALVSFPVSIGIVVTAPILIPLAFEDRWSAAITPVQILALNGPRLVLGRLGGAAFQAAGLPTWELRITATSFVLSGVAFAAGLPFGIVGVATGYTVAGYIVMPVVVVLLARALATSPSDLLRPLAPVAAATAAMALAVILAELATAGWEDGVRLAIAVATGATVYFAVLWVSARSVIQRGAADLLGRSR